MQPGPGHHLTYGDNLGWLRQFDEGFVDLDPPFNSDAGPTPESAGHAPQLGPQRLKGSTR